MLMAKLGINTEIVVVGENRSGIKSIEKMFKEYGPVKNTTLLVAVHFTGALALTNQNRSIKPTGLNLTKLHSVNNLLPLRVYLVYLAMVSLT